MENRTAEITQAFGAPAEGASGLLSLHQYELLFEMTTQLLAASSLEDRDRELDWLAASKLPLSDAQRGRLESERNRSRELRTQAPP